MRLNRHEYGSHMDGDPAKSPRARRVNTCGVSGDQPDQSDTTPNRNEVDGSVTGAVVQAGTVHGGIHVHSRRRSVFARRPWLWIGTALSVVAVVVAVLLSALRPDTSAAGATDAEAVHVNDLTSTPTVGAHEFTWATADRLGSGQADGARTGADVSALMASTGGVPVGSTGIDVVLEGRSEETVLVQQITARIVSTGDALSGTVVAPPDVGGPVPKYGLGFDLDEAVAHARTPDGRGGLGARFSDDNVFEIGPGEKYAFNFQGIVRTAHAYRWVIDLRLLVGDERQTMTLGADNPFSVTGPAHTYDRYLRHTTNDEEGLAMVTAQTICPTGDCLANADLLARVY